MLWLNKAKISIKITSRYNQGFWALKVPRIYDARREGLKASTEDRQIDEPVKYFSTVLEILKIWLEEHWDFALDTDIR